MTQKRIPYRNRLAALFTSFSILIMGTGSLMRSMSMDYYTVLNTLVKVGPACITMGLIGWVMGMILDQPKRRTRISYNNHFANDLIKTRLPEISVSGADEPITEGI